MTGRPTLGPASVTAGPTDTVDRPVMLQDWQVITWLHWPVEPSAVQDLLPADLTVDTFDGRAWVGLVPFRMTRLRPPGLPAVPWLTTFPEINVRTYVIGPDGRRAVWFLSLDAPRAPAIALARLAFGLPYCWAQARIDVDRTVRYRSRRRWPGAGAGGHGAMTDITVRPGRVLQPAEVDERDLFLTARFGLYAVRRGRLRYGPVDHPPWPLRRAELVHLDDELVTAAGLPAPDGPPLVHHADGVPVRVGMLQPATGDVRQTLSPAATSCG